MRCHINPFNEESTPSPTISSIPQEVSIAAVAKLYCWNCKSNTHTTYDCTAASSRNCQKFFMSIKDSSYHHCTKLGIYGLSTASCPEFHASRGEAP